ncbi:very short patch repair endonuclease [Burkholderia orbicola]|uniref:very short patch repair endonuclease n=1 Tax=Burkholderia orbicola TaxID=2978683 RepID=UPI00264CD7BB|nr:very short patch repair endonuclease [Burkholderia orbicola]MDN7485988.1 very short patch repair endonuclease [Burkholderia orbicola]
MKTPDPDRSRIMRAVRSKDTRPELEVRRLLFSRGYRYRLHRKDLAGSPDLVFPGRKKVIFIHGCFWHGHDCRRGAREPATNVSYWRDKINRNRARDQAALERLVENGWSVEVIWECELGLSTRLALLAKLEKFLGPPGFTHG